MREIAKNTLAYLLIGWAGCIALGVFFGAMRGSYEWEVTAIFGTLVAAPLLSSGIALYKAK